MLRKIAEKTSRKGRMAPDNSMLWCVIDALCLFAGFFLSALILYGGPGFSAAFTAQHSHEAILCVVLGMFFMWGFEMYSIVLLEPMPMLITMILSCLYVFACAVLAQLVLFGHTEHILFMTVGCAVGFTVLLAWREGLYYYHKHNLNRQRMLMIEKIKDDNSRVRRMKYACLSRFDAWYEQVDVNDMDKVRAFIQERFPAYDVICLMESVPFEVRDMFLSAGNQMGKEFYIVPAMYEMNFAKVRLAFFDDVMVFHLLPDRVNPLKMVIKRVMDIALSLLGCIVAAIPMLIIALLVKLTSPGPVIYKQERLTRGKRVFNIYKFRSMVQDAETASGPVIATKSDPRVTGVGKWLRKMRLDELPQLFNILKGDMSIVGPRPERPFFVEQYEKTVENYDGRFAVRAGLTALSHVYGRYSTDVIDRTRYDLLYIQNYSLMLDAKVILLTTRTVFLSDAAEGVWTVDRRTQI